VKKSLKSLALLTLMTLYAGAAAAGGTGMPWEERLTQIRDSITGPVAQVLAVIAITVTGLAIAFGEGGAGMKKMLWIVFGISIAFAATSFFVSFFGFSGGVVL
jgi:type IV secretion system protein TrbC